MDDNLQLECVAATPDNKIYLYGPVANHSSGFIVACIQKLEETKDEVNTYFFMLNAILFMLPPTLSIIFLRFMQCVRMIRKEQCDDFQELHKQIKTLERNHGNLIFCLENIGLQGASYVTSYNYIHNISSLMLYCDSY